MSILRTTAGGAAGALFLVQGVTSLALPPSAGNSYSGTTGDIVNDSVFVAALAALAVFLLADRHQGTAKLAGAGLIASAGSLMLSAATVATVIAGHERWDTVFVLGFALAELGFLATVLGRRSLGYAAMVLGMVLVLAFFDSAGGLALGLAALLATREATPRRSGVGVSTVEASAVRRP